MKVQVTGGDGEIEFVDMPARWHWYVRRQNEIFLDLDSPSRLFQAMRKVERNRQLLDVRDVHVYPSGTPKHYHMIVWTAGLSACAKNPIERAVWAQELGSDRRRAQYIVMRVLRFTAPEWTGGERAGNESKAANADFLITPHPYPFRKPDRACACEAKHKEKSVTDACPVMQSLLGEERSEEYFALEPRVQFKYGEVNLDEILKEDTRWKK